MKYIPLYLAAVLLLCLAPMPYGYFTIVRIMATVVFGLYAYRCYQAKKEGMTWMFVTLALLFQPFAKVALGRTLWNIVDVIVAIGLIYLFFWERNNCSLIGNCKASTSTDNSLSRMTITHDYRIILNDYHNIEIKMEPIVKAVYLLFLNHPEGIAFKRLPDYREELMGIYIKMKPLGLNDKAIRSIEDVTNPVLNSINEKCSRIRAAFQSHVDATLADQYIIIGKSGEAKKISLPRELVNWE